jgi:protocatechuate 3,4-dioxygenase beta subunit
VKITASEVAVSAVLLLVGCESDGSPPATATSTAGTTTTAGSTAAASGCTLPTLPPVARGSVVVPGPTGGLGPSEAGGEPLVIEAVVLDAACQPLSGASVDLWHTDARGIYRPEGSDGLYYHGSVRTDENGRLRIETIRPAQYPEPGAPPPHIHFDIRHSAARLQTEIVFTDTPAPTRFTAGTNTVPIPLTRVDGAWHGQAALVIAT